MASAISFRNIPVDHVQIGERSSRNIISSDVAAIAARFPIERERIGRDVQYVEEYLEQVESSINPRFHITESLRSIVHFAFSLQSGDRLLHPITVCQVDTQFRLISGTRRYLAHVLLGEPTINARIFIDEPSSLECQLIFWEENAHRRDLTLFEKIYHLSQMIKSWKIENDTTTISVNKFAMLAGMQRSDAMRYLAVIRTPSKLLLSAIENGGIEDIKKAAKLTALPIAELDARLSSAKAHKRAR